MAKQFEHSPKDILNIAILLGILLLMLLNLPGLLDIGEDAVARFVDTVVVPDIQRGNDGPFGTAAEKFMSAFNSDRVRALPVKDRKKAIDVAFKNFTAQVQMVIESKATSESQKKIAGVFKRALTSLSETVTSPTFDTLPEKERDDIINHAINDAIVDIGVTALPEIVESVPDIKRMLKQVVLDFLVAQVAARKMNSGVEPRAITATRS